MVAVTSTQGDTTVVEVRSGSVWERPVRLREELRIGTLDGSEEQQFGDLAYLAVSPDGTIFAFDRLPAQLVRFSPEGDFLGRVGRVGEGPGEHSDGVTGITIVNGELLLADPDNQRVAAYSLEGDYLGLRGTQSGLRGLFSPTLRATEGGYAARIIADASAWGSPNAGPAPIGYEIRSADGAVQDTIQPQLFEGEPTGYVELAPWGDRVVSNGADVRFELRGPDGSVVRVQMPFEGVPYTEHEVRMLGQMLRRVAQADGQTEVETVPLKNGYLGFMFSSDERIWARRSAPDDPSRASWRAPRHQPSVLDVFERDGTYLGEVPLPRTANPIVVQGDRLYVVELGDFDEPYLVRYRLDVG